MGFDFWFLELSRVHRGLGCRKQRRRPFTWRRRFVVESPVFLQPTSPTRQTGLSTRKIAFSRTSQLPGGGSHSRLCRHRAKRNPLVPVCVWIDHVRVRVSMCACEWVCVRVSEYVCGRPCVRLHLSVCVFEGMSFTEATLGSQPLACYWHAGICK